MLSNSNKVPKFYTNGVCLVPERKDDKKWHTKLCRNLMELSSKVRFLSATNC